MNKVKKIVIIGPESTGKSTLCKLLAAHFKTIWCPEYAREYLLRYGAKYTYDDLLTIAKGQIALEEKYLDKAIEYQEKQMNKSASPMLIADTDLYVMKVWCEYVFGKCHSYILDRIADRTCDLYLLCNVDLPWVEDEFRECPDLHSRKELLNIYKDILINQNAPWAFISGNYEERLQFAIESITRTLLI